VNAATLAPTSTAPLPTPGRPRFTALPPLALYVHIPWCVRKCPYCDFNSHEARGEAPEAAYVDALLADLEFALPAVWGRKVTTVFIGGGTPSLFSAAAIDRLLAGVRARLPLVPDAEITMEANPGTFERERFSGYRDAGINRLSLGIQSFDDRHLAALGRIHDSGEARAAAEAAIAIFGNVNLDLMYALPRQSPDEARRDATIATALAPAHLSAYHLTLEPNTLFHRYPPPIPDDDAAAAIEEAVHATIVEAGYEQYETSAFARAGRQCRHNRNYWEFGDYLGIGAGAHSKLSLRDRVFRQMRWKQPKQYLDEVAKGAPVQDESTVTRRDIGFEFMLNALRLVDGVPSTSFAERTGYPLAIVEREIAEAVRRGLLDADPTTIRPTPLGRRFLNDLQALFLQDEPR
jgi:oxygen-independent coproporphyrinogen-3 oxidase